ncbi:hypothetical protein IRJ41_024607, partial [Triplophysa rosa]
TNPKQKPCPHCQTPSNASCLGIRQKFKAKQKNIEESVWRCNTKKHRNAARVVDSARIAVKKLEVLGCKPVLFISKEQKKGFLAEVITSIGPCAKGPLQNIFDKMTGLYEYFIKNFLSSSIFFRQPSSSYLLFYTVPTPSPSSNLPPPTSSFDTLTPSPSSSNFCSPASSFYTHPPASSSFDLPSPTTSYISLLPPAPSTCPLLPPPPSVCSLPPTSCFYTLTSPSSSSNIPPCTSSYISLLSSTSSSFSLPQPPPSLYTPPPTSTSFSSNLFPPAFSFPKHLHPTLSFNSLPFSLPPSNIPPSTSSYITLLPPTTSSCTLPPPPPSSTCSIPSLLTLSLCSPSTPATAYTVTSASRSSCRINPRPRGKQSKWLYKQAGNANFDL